MSTVTNLAVEESAAAKGEAGIMVVDSWAAWCGPSSAMARQFVRVELAAESPLAERVARRTLVLRPAVYRSLEVPR